MFGSVRRARERLMNPGASGEFESPVSPDRDDPDYMVNEMNCRVYWVVMPNLINETLIFQPNIPKKKTEITNSITRNVMVFISVCCMSRWTSHYGIIDWPILAISIQNRSSLFHIGLLKWYDFLVIFMVFDEWNLSKWMMKWPQMTLTI